MSDAPLPPLAAIPPELDRLAAYEARAERHMPPASWAHLQSGADRDITLAENRAAFDRLKLMPRMLADLRGGHTEIELFGQRHAAPLMLAPIAYQRLAHPEGELATARAAMAMGVGMIVSTLSSVTIEEIAAAAKAAAKELAVDPAPLWFQLYLQEDRAWNAELVRRAEDAGYQAIVLTVDAAIKRSGFPLPPGVEAANLRGMARHVQTSGPHGRILFGTPLADTAPRWGDLTWLRAQTRLPLLIKGVLSPLDAKRAVGEGVDGLIVSNHGGRVLDGLPTALDAMPAILTATEGKVPLLLDGGVRQGSDIVKALALGAAAVLIGRPQMHGLAVAGMPGVAHVLHLLRAELELAMAQLGCRTPGEIGPETLFSGR